jgi:hypothetical protein
MEDWQELLGDEWEGVEDQYGPNSQAVVSAFDVLGRIPWFRRVGKPIPRKANVVTVRSWEEALAEFEAESEQYDISGHLRIPADRCAAVMEKEPYRQWWEQAVADAGDVYSYKADIPNTLEPYLQDWLDNYLYQYISNLLAEIIGTDSVKSTYFREILPWFLEGHFPCGWKGEWPAGQLRVY